MNECPRVDEVFGDVYDHVVKDARGYPDRRYLHQQNQLAHSMEVPESVRLEARKFLGMVALDYKLATYGTIINRQLNTPPES
jgi:hypothetical protein